MKQVLARSAVSASGPVYQILRFIPTAAMCGPRKSHSLMLLCWWTSSQKHRQNVQVLGGSEMDSGWLAILKASAWQLLGLSLAFGILWLLIRADIIPASDSPFIVYGLPLAMLITAGLGLASLNEQVTKSVTAALKKRREAREQDRRLAEHQRKFIEHIPYMTNNELAIYGYLLEHSQKSFTAEMAGGHAASLYKRRFIQTDAQNGHSYGIDEFPFSVPDHIWSVLEENREKFPTEFKGRKLPWIRGNY